MADVEETHRGDELPGSSMIHMETNDIELPSVHSLEPFERHPRAKGRTKSLRERKKSKSSSSDEDENPLLTATKAIRKFKNRVIDGNASDDQDITTEVQSALHLSQTEDMASNDASRLGAISSPPEPERFEAEYDQVPLPVQKKVTAAQKTHDTPECLVANTVLILPLQWAEPLDADSSKWINRLLRRSITDKYGNESPLWQINLKLPTEVFDLDPHFRSQLGCYVESPSELRKMNRKAVQLQMEEGDKIWRLDLTPQARKLLFSNVRMEGTFLRANPAQPQEPDKDVRSVCPVQFTRVNLLVFPYGTALLQFHINWLPNGRTLTLDELRTWLYLAKTLRGIPGVFRGWLLGDDLINFNWRDLPNDHLQSLGPRLCSVLYDNKPISLVSLANLLVASRSPKTIHTVHTRSYHHTAVVVNQELKGEVLNEYFFHLRRAKGQLNRPPPQTDHLESLIQPRKNRRIGICREGTVSLSWPATQSKDDYECKHWPAQFQGIYRILTLHVHGEKLTLSALGAISSLQGQKLRKKWIATKVSFEQMKKGRRKMLAYMALVTQYTLQMSSDDCGGYTEYVQYFTATRKVFGISKQRKELTVELREVATLIESNFNEEQQKLAKIDHFQKGLASERKARSQLILAIFSSFTIPVVIISGLFGMNNDDLPKEAPWAWLVIGSVIVSVAFLLLYLIVSAVMKKRDRGREQNFRNRLLAH